MEVRLTNMATTNFRVTFFFSLRITNELHEEICRQSSKLLCSFKVSRVCLLHLYIGDQTSNVNYLLQSANKF